ncbi:MAG: hypothetical protein DRG78_08655 [Epsilonproteobacteria bacterium]|nr:MAG: hypothetical protein DRG78_08655 [Campylobacterota bacterium]
MKRLLFGFSILLISIGFSGCGSNVDTVKDGTMNFNNSTTLGKALDNWQECSSSKWSEFETKNGMKIVELTCNGTSFMSQINKYKDSIASQNAYNNDIDFESSTFVFQFTINDDNTFDATNAREIITMKSGKTKEQQYQSASAVLEAYVYTDKLVHINEYDFVRKAAFTYTPGKK